MEYSKNDTEETLYNWQHRRGNVIFFVRLWLGTVFIYAGLNKVFNVKAFRDSIVTYEILPYWIINVAALLLPWLELWTGVFLIAGIFVKACVIVQSGLLLAFTLAMTINVLRGLECSCGCFGEGGIDGSLSYEHIALNLLWMILAFSLIALERRRFSHRFPFWRLFFRKTGNLSVSE